MAGETALERQALVVQGERAELRLEDGHLTVHKDATTQERPTEVTVAVDRVRGAELEAPPRGGQGWLHLSVVGGSPPPPTGLAAAGDPYTLPVGSRGAGAARKLVRMVERHVQERGLPSDVAAPGASSGVVLNPAGAPSPKEPYAAPAPTATATGRADRAADGEGGQGPGSDLVARLRELADLHAGGALTDDEFQRAKARLLG